MQVLNSFIQYLKIIRIQDVIDILLVTFLMYQLYALIRHSNAMRLLKGIALFLIIAQVSEWLQLFMLNFLFVNTLQIGLLAIVVIFQPELRRMLESVGRSSLSRIIENSQSPMAERPILQTVEACQSMAETRTGALIVFERNSNLEEIAKTGTLMHADLSADLLKNIFFPNTPLHDGAVIVRQGQILSAGCVLPLSGNVMLSRDLGTRHRAAVGVSEANDCVCVIVSEETGIFSVAIDGVLKRHLSAETLERLLISELIVEPERKPTNKFFSRLRRHK